MCTELVGTSAIKKRLNILPVLLYSAGPCNTYIRGHVMKSFFPAIMSILFFAVPCLAVEPEVVTVTVPGPRNISYLPIDLIPKIGADTAEGVRLRIQHTSGGGVALSKMAHRDADFAVAGLPAQMSMRARGGDVITIAPVDDLTLFILMVRSELKGKVTRVADLKGRTIGVNASSLSSKTTSQQLAELLLKNNDVDPSEVRILPAGQSWAEQSAVIKSGAVDAIMGDEPFASRLQAEKKVFFLLNMSDPATIKQTPGAGFLHAALATRSDLIARQPEKVAKMVAAVRRVLAWMAAKTPQEIVAALEIADKTERAALLASLKKYKRLYSTDGKFSTHQLHETETFFRASSGTDKSAAAVTVEQMVNATWAGRKP